MTFIEYGTSRKGAARRIEDRRVLVELLVRQKDSEREIARKLRVSRSTVWNDKQALKAAGALG